ncbi:MAG: CPBP family intramembrane metalloprotease [Candidatus Aegiribacteria sp.]|nr:CPBP family intramembrane metalloprotease [Candidatus Aegiribacteria sp.]
MFLLVKGSERDHGSIQIGHFMNTHGKITFLERRCSPPVRPFFRLGITLAGFFLWVLLQEFLSGFFNLTENIIPNYAVAGFIALIVLFPLWKMVPEVAGRAGRKNGRIAAAASAVLFIPFIVIALLSGLEYVGITSGWLLFAAALFLLAASEEVICRGFMMDALSFRGCRLSGLLLSSLAFAMLHLSNSHAAFAGIVNIFLAGALFGFLRLVTDGLFYPILAHWLWNLATGMVFGWNVSGHTLLPTIFRTTDHPPWGAFGPEESILMTIGTLGAIAVLIKKLYLSDNDALPGIHKIS